MAPHQDPEAARQWLLTDPSPAEATFALQKGVVGPLTQAEVVPFIRGLVATHEVFGPDLPEQLVPPDLAERAGFQVSDGSRRSRARRDHPGRCRPRACDRARPGTDG